jgi:GTP-binding protein
LKVLSAEFVTSASASAVGVPKDALPQVALAGRSNVGKSSLINALTRRRIARTSAAPGKTRLANVYRVELEGVPRQSSGQADGPGRLALYLVDLPGYGYARRGAESARELKLVAEAYFSPDHGTRDALLLIDSRHPGLDADIQAARWLVSRGIGAHIVATKIDKLTRSERARNLDAIGNTFGTAALPVSASSGEGLDELWRMIARIARDADRVE